jgi:two-component system, OmpR family, sensor kinase
MQALTDEFGALFERFLQLPLGKLELALAEAADLVAEALGADKVDVFVYQAARSSLVALGTSRQPLSRLQRQAGLDVLPLANGGLAAKVFETHQPLLTGNTMDDPSELRGIREVLKIDSQIAVLIKMGETPHGVLVVASHTRDRWGAQHLSFTQAVARWLGIVVHRAELLAELERRSIDEGRRAAAEELVTVVAHDLRNHLSPLAMRLDRLLRRAKRDGREDDTRELTHSIKSLSRATAFVSDLLDVARIDRGLFELNTEPLDVVSLARDVLSLASTGHTRVQLHAQEDLVAIADPFRIRQCLENLVANALTHSPGSEVTVQLASESNASGSWVRIEVIDDGPGIAEHILPHIFDRFVSGKRGNKGLGLGLYIAKRIATLHGGDLTVDSPPAGGTRFILTLPQDN